MASMLTEGRVVAGRFRIEGVLGEGGMGTVYLARHLTLPRFYAIKVSKGQYLQDETFVERFRREAIAASQVEHPNVVYITDFGHLEEGDFYLVMEYLEGVGLDEIIDCGGAQPLSRALPILIQLADALDYSASVGIVHRDLKPENVMLCEIRGRKDVVKLVDFGIARIIQPEYDRRRITLSGQIFGTPEYVSPEQAMDLEVDGRSDIYSLGIIAYELVTGDAPFLGEPADVLQMQVQQPPPPPSAHMPRQLVPPGFDGLVLRCLAKSPSERFQTASEVCRELLKMRGQLAGMADDLVGSSEPAQISGRVSTSGAWGTLSAERDPPFTFIDVALGKERHQGATKPGDRTLSLAASNRNLREDLHATLKEIAFSLGEAAIRSDELSEALSELLRLEEEIQAIGGQIVVLEQNFERIRFESGEQETMLRHASLDLKLLRGQILEQPRATDRGDLTRQLEDLTYQIDALDRRLAEVVEDKQRRTRTLHAEVEKYQQARSQREEDVARRYTQLHLIVEMVRSRARGEPLQRLYARLDDLSSQLQLARESVRLMRPRS